MHSFLLQSLPKGQLDSTSPNILQVMGETSIGIEEVRQIQTFLSKKPLADGQNEVYIIDAHKLTIPAQNALLKTLEEPPGQSKIYLVTTFADQLLPTVLSRVHQVSGQTSITKISEKQLQETFDLIQEIAKLSPGQKITKVDSLNLNRDQALGLLDALEYALHSNLHLRINYQTIVDVRQLLNANVNVKLCLDQLLFGL